MLQLDRVLKGRLAPVSANQAVSDGPKALSRLVLSSRDDCPKKYRSCALSFNRGIYLFQILVSPLDMGRLRFRLFEVSDRGAEREHTRNSIARPLIPRGTG